MNTNKILGVLIFCLVIASCGTKTKTDQKPTVSVSILPQKFFINRIAGNFIDVNVMVPPGGSPATYEPTPMQMKNLSHSSHYFSIGHLGFEKAWMEKFASINPQMKIINTSMGIALISDENFSETFDHDHEHDHGHEHDGYNPHIWLSPDLVKKQATIMYHALSLSFPDKKEDMLANYEGFIIECDSVQTALNNQLKPLKGTNFIVYHPVWSYLAKANNLNQISIEHNGKEATATKLKAIIDFAKTNNVHTIFVQQEFNDAQAQTIAQEINGQVISLNPLAYNWFEIMQSFSEAFQTSQN